MLKVSIIWHVMRAHKWFKNYKQINAAASASAAAS